MLTDTYLRRHTYLRVSITDLCNLRCRYCMPSQGIEQLPHESILRNEEFSDLISLFVEMGVHKVRFTGGEPLIRKGFSHIIEDVRKSHPDIELALTTNGVLLEEQLDLFRANNLKRLNISLDTLSRERYTYITGRDKLDSVLRAIEKAQSSGFFNIKVNAVLMEETLAEIDDFLEYFKGKNMYLRFIEKMPLPGGDDDIRFVPGDRIIDLLAKKGKLTREKNIDTTVALMYNLDYRGDDIKLGVIPPVTHKFCASCNRLRLTSDGHLRTCLHADYESDLKGPLRRGVSAGEIKKIILDAVARKKEGHSFDCAAPKHACSSLPEGRAMSKIGG